MGKIYTGDANNIARAVKKMYVGDDTGVARKVLKGYVGDANGIARQFYADFDPSLPTYSQSLSYPNHNGYHIILMTFVTRQKLQEAKAAGYTSLRFSISIGHAGGEGNRLGIGTSSTSYYSNTFVYIAPSETNTQTGTFTLSIDSMLANGSANFYLVLNATTTTSSSSIYAALSNPSFL